LSFMSVQFACLIEVLVGSCFTLDAVIRGTPFGLGQRASSEQAKTMIRLRTTQAIFSKRHHFAENQVLANCDLFFDLSNPVFDWPSRGSLATAPP
jgi:hypothetical protein